MKFYTTTGLLLLVLLFIETLQLCLCKNSSFNCIEEERQTLLKFKSSLHDPSFKLSSWKGTDCCKWKGVSCSRSTGHVVKLDLPRTNFESISSQYLMADEVNSCLLELRYLNYLDLSGVDFLKTPFPKFFGLMKPLRYLNLSRTNFSGMVPSQLGNLTNLYVLDLNSLPFYTAPTIQNVEWVSHLLSLHHLDMSFIDLGGAFNLMKVLNRLPSLLVLRLSSCGLNNTHLSQAYVNSTFLSTVQYLYLGDNSFRGSFPYVLQNMTSLRALDLSYNDFNSSIPLWLGNLKSLEHLNLGHNSFEGPFPHVLQNMTSLRVLNLWANSFNSSIPLWLGNFKSLVRLDLASNKFNSIEGGSSTILWNHCHLKSLSLYSNRSILRGESLDAYHNLSECISYDLEALTLRYTGLTGLLPDSLQKLKKLKYLDLGSNSFYGPIPACLGRMSTLRELDLSDNKLNGSIPDSLGQLINLKSLDISSNSLEGVVSEVHFANLSMLEDLSISSNPFTFKVKSDWLPPFQLTSIRMGSCNIGSKFPQWLQTQSKVESLSLPNASISGPMPKWLQFLPLFNLDLSHNQISGCLPQNIGDVMPRIGYLDLADNLINSTIPSSLCKTETLEGLDLSKNRLSGNIPNCWSIYQYFFFINLSSNKLTGTIPSSICSSINPWLNFLHLNNNSLTGELPLALKNCTRLELLDLGENGFYGNIPKWIDGRLQSLQILRLRKNMFNGSIPSQICNLTRLQILDLAKNNLIGTIPDCFGNLSGMILNGVPADGYLAEWDYENAMQVIKGRELEFTSILRLVVNMDLSCNNLIGTIPEELMHLSGLLGLNLSHNHLRGSIPKNIGNLTLLESLDFSTNQLSGLIPQSMSALTFLSHLNLSDNNFSGPIPTGNQLQTLNDSSNYAGNLELCGGPLPKKCPRDETPKVPIPNGYEDDNREDKSEKVWFYITVMLGYMNGLWGVVGVLLFRKSWRYALFQFVDEIYDWIFVAVAVKAARLKKKMKGNHNAD